ncbi:MAG: DNA repair protein RecO [Clostridiales bacterium]|jgi:DNA repair protein RecO (recombination protein O)|nr:DNA repair protein RecO [Clostridiales bacterium]
MSYETLTGLVAREVNTGEADRYLTLLTVESGKVECYAKGIRNQKSKLSASAGILTYGEYKLFQNRERRILTSGQTLENFSGIRTDVVKYAYAVHFLEIARDVIQEAQVFPEALRTLLNTLYVLAYREFEPELAARIFEVRMLAAAGFAPVLERCSVCGAELSARAYFALYGDGTVCGRESCRGRASPVRTVSAGTLRALRHIVECEPGELFSFAVSDPVKAELAGIVPAYLRHHFGKEYKKLGEAERYLAFEREMRPRV